MYKLLFTDEKMFPVEKFAAFPNKGVFIVGQDNDAKYYGGAFNAKQSFSGRITQMEIWNTVLPPNDIEQIARCKKASTLEANRVVTWLSDDWIANKVDFADTPLTELCQELTNSQLKISC